MLLLSLACTVSCSALPGFGASRTLFTAVTLVTGMLEAKRQVRCAGPADAFPAQAGDRRMTGADAPTASRETEPQHCQLTTAAPTTGPGPRARERPTIPRARMIEGPTASPEEPGGPKAPAPPARAGPSDPAVAAEVLGKGPDRHAVAHAAGLGEAAPRAGSALSAAGWPLRWCPGGARLACGLAPPVPAARRGRLPARPVRV